MFKLNNSTAKYYCDVSFTTSEFYTKNNIPVYMSLYGYPNDIKQLSRKIAKKPYIFSQYYTFFPNLHNIKTEYKPGVGHLVVYLKQQPIYKFGSNNIMNPGSFFFYSDKNFDDLKELITFSEEVPESICDQFYNVIQKYTDIPFLREWSSYVLKETWRNHTFASTVSCHWNSDKPNIFPIDYQLDVDEIKNVISKGLRAFDISIPGSNHVTSIVLSNVTTLDDYLNTFSTELSNKVQQSFQPLFNPTTDTFDKELQKCDDLTQYRRNITLLHDQKSVVNAVCKRLDKAYSAIIVGNMGSGKTIMSIASVYTHSMMHNKRYTNNIVMCPGHLVNKWKRELQDTYPCSEVVICDGLNSFITDVEPKLKDTHRHTNLFVVMSKDSAKGEFEEQPVVFAEINDIRHQTDIYHQDFYIYHCPSCGKAYFEDVHNKEVVYFPPDKFARKTSKTAFCPHCGEPLWAPSLGARSRYIKIPDFGWLERTVAESLYTNKYRDIDSLGNLPTKKERQLAAAIIQYHDDDTLFKPQVSRKYSLAKYIYRNFRNKIDYFIADEMHQYSGADSAQGKAFSLLVRTAKHTIGLTGTLMNGYASNLFYLLFRMFPKKMVKAGYHYTDNRTFMHQYGVMEVKKTERENTDFTKRKFRRERERPGVSPVVFTDFLLNSCVFISLEYSSPYSETPVGIDMDSDVETNYQNFVSEIKKKIDSEVTSNSSTIHYLSTINTSARGKMLMQAVNEMTLYPDQPYDRDPIFDQDTNRIVAELPEVDMSDDRILPKEQKTLELVHDAVERGEHVLIYTYWTNKTDSQQRLLDILTKNGYKADILTNAIASKKREFWISQKVKSGMQVLICNPTLVETGLDLLDFTTIIFYQLGYKLVTMRQASRRSYRLNQKNPVHVYFLYYKGTAQEQALAIMALKLHAATALEGDFSSEGLAAINSDDTDILGQLAKSIVEDDKYTIDQSAFENTNITEDDIQIVENDQDNVSNTQVVDIFNTKDFQNRKKRSMQDIYLPAFAVSW